MQKKYRQILDENGEDIGLESYYEEIAPKNRYKEGNKFLEYAKMKKKRVSESMLDQTSRYEDSESQKGSQGAINVKALKKSQPLTKEEKAETEREIWELRARNMEQMTHHMNSPKQFEHIKVSYENLDKKAADKESLLKHGSMSIEDHILQKSALDQFYLESIKQKMKLL